VRTYVLVVCVALLIAALWARAWAKADMSGNDYLYGHGEYVEAGVWVGALSARECQNGLCELRELRDFDKIDDAGQAEGRYAFIAGAAAALAFAIAAGFVYRRRRLPLGTRAVLAVPGAISLVATIVFAERLMHVSWMHVSWSPFAAAGAALAGALTMLMEPQYPASATRPPPAAS